MATFVFDLDGTICFDRRSISPVIRRSVETIGGKHSIVIASARHPVNIVTTIANPWFAVWDIVGANGAISYARGRLVDERRLPINLTAVTLQTLTELKCAFLAYGADFVVFSEIAHPLHAAISADIGTHLRRGEETEINNLIKVLALPVSGDARPLEACQKIPGLQIYPHSDGTFDVIADGVDKASALQALGYVLPVFAGFGNDVNDAPLLRRARHSVCVGDNRLLQSIASRQIPDGPQQIDAIAELILQLGAEADDHAGLQQYSDYNGVLDEGGLSRRP